MKNYADFIYKFRYRVLFFWILLFIVSAIFAAKLPAVLQGSGFEKEGEFTQVSEVLYKDFGLGKSNIWVLFEETKPIPEVEWNEFIASSLAEFSTIKELTKISSSLIHKEQQKENVAYAILDFDQEMDEMKPVIGGRDRIGDFY
jgi:RND superfamily putative drug exporter